MLIMKKQSLKICDIYHLCNFDNHGKQNFISVSEISSGIMHLSG